MSQRLQMSRIWRRRCLTQIKGKPQNIAEKIIAGKLKKFYKECVLLEQDFYADSEKSVDQYLKEQSKKLGAKRFRVCF